ncbi:DUF6924 domain-containing protein [Ornithinimicrobium panacihumi]|uniref:DUF6924 domain-containing protein n=1 Tax=Ornithinimicrobium panacihumi TaxID=2008449 RepID=UPI003F8A2AA9
MRLPAGPMNGLLLLRTDYGHDEAWRRALAAATRRYPLDEWRGGATLAQVESQELTDLSAEDVARLDEEDYLTAVVVVDTRTMVDHTLLLVDLNPFNEQVHQTFRTIPEELEPIVANLALANMDFFEMPTPPPTTGCSAGSEPQAVSSDSRKVIRRPVLSG